ncbi:hypothetical protein, partial [Bradyrhizobium canariense]|uniref:hypothetical protein n=1 Tax=Bradyrhizobium canariense TaxID=255045 RepID=UPI001AEC8862
PRSLTSLTASILNSRLNFRLCMTHLWLDKTPNLGVHQTGSSSVCMKYHLRLAKAGDDRIIPMKAVTTLAGARAVCTSRRGVGLE